MSYKRMAAAIGAAYLVSQILAIAVHGFILAADYQPYYGRLLRAQPGPQMLLLLVSHLSFVVGLVWVYSRVRLEGSSAVRGVKLGLFGWIIGGAPMWLLWYAEQPWPGDLVIKQLVLDLASMIVIGVAIALVAPYESASASRAAYAETNSR
jgi:hypothetical protein